MRKLTRLEVYNPTGRVEHVRVFIGEIGVANHWAAINATLHPKAGFGVQKLNVDLQDKFLPIMMYGSKKVNAFWWDGNNKSHAIKKMGQPSNDLLRNWERIIEERK